MVSFGCSNTTTILDGGELCTVCRKEVRGESEPSELPELCSECGENPVVPGQELCAYCLKELARRTDESTDDAVEPTAANIEIDSVSSMDEIELDIPEDMDGEVFDDEDDEDKEDDEEEEE